MATPESSALESQARPNSIYNSNLAFTSGSFLADPYYGTTCSHIARNSSSQIGQYPFVNWNKKTNWCLRFFLGFQPNQLATAHSALTMDKVKVDVWLHGSPWNCFIACQFNHIIIEHFLVDVSYVSLHGVWKMWTKWCNSSRHVFASIWWSLGGHRQTSMLLLSKDKSQLHSSMDREKLISYR